MAKVNKEYQWRQEGMIYAYKIASEEGIEALEKEIKMRGILKLDIWADKEDMEKMYRTFNVLQNNMTVSASLMALKRTEGFGTQRLHRVHDEYLRNAKDTGDLNYLGQHYVTFSDYAKVLNEEHGFDFDITLIEALQDIEDEKDPRIGKPDIKVLISELRYNGFDDAADWLEEKVG